MYRIVDGNLITMAQEGHFDVIAHGCNCFCRMGAGIAPQMAKAFSCDAFPLEDNKYKGDINKLGQIDYKTFFLGIGKENLTVVNAYTQYHFLTNMNPTPLDYEALILCMRKINHNFSEKHIGLPKIGAGLAGGNWTKINEIIRYELKDCNVTIVNYKK